MFNGYKKIIKNRETRQKILRMLNFLPDRLMLRLQYFVKFKRHLKLKNPTRFTEKLQWYKLYYKDPLMIKCVDKWDVRDYVKSKGFKNILNDCYGVYDSPDEVDFEKLPDKFVIKDTLGGGGNSLIICTDKEKADFYEFTEKMKKWIAAPLKKTPGREWPYSSGKNHRIIIEKYLEAEDEKKGITDYKFYCLNGEIAFINVMFNRELGQKAKLTICDRNFDMLDVYRDDEDRGGPVEKPANFDEMVKIAEQMSADFPEVRVDLYDEFNKIVFGELTFYGSSGYIPFRPSSFDVELGEKFVLPEKRKLTKEN